MPTADLYATFVTNFGNITVDLFETDAPVSVNNFLHYVPEYQASGNFMHRLVHGFVLQGGGFRYVDNQVLSNATTTPIQNEYSASRPNVQGTIAWAKLSGDPNSATDQFFFNLGDNSSNLGSQNGGFTVFGQVTSGWDVVQQIAMLQVKDFGSPFDELPTVDYSSGPVQPSNLVTFSVDVNPTIVGTVGGQTAINSSIQPFSQVAISDLDVGQIQTVTVTFTAANGTLSGGGFAGADGVYTVSGSDVQVQGALRAATFTPTPDQATSTTLTISVSDGIATSVDAATSVISGVSTTPTEGADVLTGTPNDDAINGLGGNDRISGAGGNDTLTGGAGNDTMIGGLGNDTYFVDNVGDVVTENVNEGIDTVQTTLASYSLGPNVENLTFIDNGAHTGFGNALTNVMIGGDGDDTLVGNADPFASVADTLSGGNGNDTILGEPTDTIDGGTGADTLFAVNSNPWTIDLGATSIETMQAGFGDDHVDASTQITGVTIFAGGGNDTVIGSRFDDFLWGGAGNDTLTGGIGNDLLFGDVGADNLSGGAGDDTIYADGADTIDGGDGHDVLYWTDTVTPPPGDHTIYADGADTIDGGDGHDVLYWTDTVTPPPGDLATLSIEWVQTQSGDAPLNFATGSNDVIAFAGTGNNTVTGGAGNDFLWGEAGNDIIVGGAGNDTLVGGAGADRLTGGAGTDNVYGNIGGGGDGVADTYVFDTPDWGTDFVYDFDDGVDKFDMHHSGATDFSALTVTASGPHAQIAFGGNLIVVVGAAGLIDSSDFVF